MNQTTALHHWSGSLLCSFGLYLAQKRENVLCLVNFRGLLDAKPMNELISAPVLRRLSDSLALPLFMPAANPESIQNDIQALLTLVNQKYGVHSVVLNSFNTDSEMDILRKHYEDASLHVQNYLRESKPEDLFEEAISLGFKAHIFSVNEKSLNRGYLSAPLTLEMAQMFKTNNINPFGVNGEFGTICVGGPNFAHNVPVNFGDVHSKNGFWYREVIAG